MENKENVLSEIKNITNMYETNAVFSEKIAAEVEKQNNNIKQIDMRIIGLNAVKDL